MVCSPATWFPASKEGRESEMKRPQQRRLRRAGVLFMMWCRCRCGSPGRENGERHERKTNSRGEDAAHLSNIGFPLPFLRRSARCGGCNDCVCSEFWVREQTAVMGDGRARNLSERADERTKAAAPPTRRGRGEQTAGLTDRHVRRFNFLPPSSPLSINRSAREKINRRQIGNSRCC